MQAILRQVFAVRILKSCQRNTSPDSTPIDWPTAAPVLARKGWQNIENYRGNQPVS